MERGAESGVPAAWKTALYAVLGSVVGTVGGVVAGEVLYILLIFSVSWLGWLGLRPYFLEDRFGTGFIFFGFFGALLGFLLGVAAPLIRHAWKLPSIGPVLRIFAGAVAGLVLGIVTFGVFGALIGFVLGFTLFWRLCMPGKFRARGGSGRPSSSMGRSTAEDPNQSRVPSARYSTWALVIAAVGAAPAIVGVALLCLAFLVRACAPSPWRGYSAAQIIERWQRVNSYEGHRLIDFWARTGSYVALCGFGIGVWALRCAYRSGLKHRELSGPAPSRRRRAVRLGLVALVLNGVALTWLYKEGELHPGIVWNDQSPYDPPSAIPRSSGSPGSPGESQSGQPATKGTPP